MLSSNFVDTPGLRIHYLPGGGGRTGGVPARLPPDVVPVAPPDGGAGSDRGYACFAPDNRGFGSTDKPRVRISRGLLARDVARFMDAAGAGIGPPGDPRLGRHHRLQGRWPTTPQRVRSIGDACSTPCARCGIPRSQPWLLVQGRRAWPRSSSPRSTASFIDVILSACRRRRGTLPGRAGLALAGFAADPVSEDSLAVDRRRGPAITTAPLSPTPTATHAAIQLLPLRAAVPSHRRGHQRPDGSGGRSGPCRSRRREVGEMWSATVKASPPTRPTPRRSTTSGPRTVRCPQRPRRPMWMFSKYLGGPRGPARAAGGSRRPRHTPVPRAVPPATSPTCETHAVAAGHFLPEEAADYVTAELLRFLPLR